MENELLPCPFCGGEADEYEGNYGNGVYCMNCGAMVGEPIHLEYRVTERVTYEQAIAAWNTRADYHGYEQAAIEAWQNIKAYKERTCNLFKLGAMYDVARYSCCGYEFPENVGEKAVAENYCPNCGARVTEAD